LGAYAQEGGHEKSLLPGLKTAIFDVAVNREITEKIVKQYTPQIKEAKKAGDADKIEAITKSMSDYLVRSGTANELVKDAFVTTFDTTKGGKDVNIAKQSASNARSAIMDWDKKESNTGYIPANKLAKTVLPDILSKMNKKK
jgi:hypothetical protein